MKKLIPVALLTSALLFSCGGTPEVSSSSSNESSLSSTSLPPSEESSSQAQSSLEESSIESSTPEESSLEESSLEESSFEESSEEASSVISSQQTNEGKPIDELLDQLKAYNGHLQTVNDYSRKQHSISFYGEKGMLVDDKGGLIRTSQGICEYVLENEQVVLTGIESIGDISIYDYFYSGFFRDLISSLPLWEKDPNKNRYYCHDEALILSAAKSADSFYWDYFDFTRTYLQLEPLKTGFTVVIKEMVVTSSWEMEMECSLNFTKLGSTSIEAIDAFLENPTPLEKRSDYGFDQIQGFKEAFGDATFPFVDSFGAGLFSYVEGNQIVVFDVTAPSSCKQDLKEAFLLEEGWYEDLEEEERLLESEKQEIYCFAYTLSKDDRDRPLTEIALSFTFVTYEYLLETAPDYAPCYPSGYFKMMFGLNERSYPIEDYSEFKSDLYSFFGRALPLFDDFEGASYAYLNSTDEMDAYTMSLAGVHTNFFAELFVLFEGDHAGFIDAYGEILLAGGFTEYIPEDSDPESSLTHERSFEKEASRIFKYNISVVMELSFLNEVPNGVVIYFVANQD